MAELSTATPKAGGGYFFIDRALGPLFGTIGGAGNYLALVLKTAFALVGIGAYAVLFFDIPVKLTAIIFGLIFMIMNILGVKKASGVQKIFVSEANIAKLASSFQLLIFMLINASVIVMRKSKIEAYDPGYHSPFYPCMQIFGIVSSFFLIIYLGWGPGLFTLIITGISITWYWYYARKRSVRAGAIYHWFALWGKIDYKELEGELLNILKEKGLRDGDPFGEMIVHAAITDINKKRISFDSLVSNVSKKFAQDIKGLDKDMLKREFMDVTSIDPALIIPRVSILYGKVANIECPVLHIVLSRRGVKKTVVKG